jgi:hypothetical protein
MRKNPRACVIVEVPSPSREWKSVVTNCHFEEFKDRVGSSKPLDNA